MLYLEDYLEMIENLPMEMRERLTEMREMDLQVQNALDNLDDRVKVFFKRCIQPNQKTDWKDEQFQSLKQDYFKVLDDADEKVHLANHIYDLVDRHLRKLDQELAKFKMELEADNAGITEVLEKRSLELDVPPPAMNNHRPDKRRIISSSPALTSHTEKQITTERVLSSLATEVAKETIGQRRASAVTNPTPINVFNSGNNSQAGVTYSLGQMGAGSNAAIAAAASQAIAATQQMQQGRRTPSMKASYVAMGRHADLAKELTFGKEIAYSTQPVSTPPPNAEITTQRTQRTKKQSKAAAASSAASAVTQQPQAASVQQAQATPQPAVPQASPQAEEYPTELQIVDENGQPVDWQDPNEPRYCLCNNVSYGDMVGCDNDDCPIEWFHYGCVGLTQAPKGKWYCPQCTMAMKRRGRR